MPTNGQAVKIAHYSRSKFNSLTNKDSATIYYVEESDGKIKQYIGNTHVVSDSVPWTGVSGKPTFATVATSGSYNDLSNKPSIPSAYTLTKSKIDSALMGVGLPSIQIGPDTNAGGDNSISLGISNSASGASSTALGSFTSASGTGSIAIGSGTVVTEDNVADFGSNRQVRVNLTPVNDRDAVSKKYLENNTRSNTWTPSWSQVSGKPSWIGSSKPSYNLDEISDGSTYKRFTATEKSKLEGIAAGAQVNVGTNLSQGARNATTLRIDSSTGSNLTLPAVTTSLAGLMTSTDKTRLDVLHSLLEEDTANNVVDSINEVLAIFNNYPEGADLVTAFAGKVDKVSGKGLSTNDYTTTEKNKLSGIATGATNLTIGTTASTAKAGNYHPTWSQVTSKPSWIGASKPTYTASEVGAASTTHTHGTATTSAAGFMSGADKTKLNGISANATANSGTVTNVSSGTQVSGLTLSVANGTTTPTITTSISNAANFRSAIGAGTSSFNGNYNYLTNKLVAGTNITIDSNNVISASGGGGGDYELTQIKIAMASMGPDPTAIQLGYSATASNIASTALGYDASASVYQSTALGYGTSASGVGSTALGYGASTGTSANLIQLGSTGGLSTLRSRVNLTVTSDIRDKADILEVPKALDFIKDLNPITYVANDRDHYISEEQKETDTYKDYLMVEDYDKTSHSQGTKKGSRRRVGLSAQEVRDKLIEHYGSDNYANVVNDNFVEFEERELDIPEGLENKLTMSYETMVPFLIKAIQEQQEQIEELKIIIINERN